VSGVVLTRRVSGHPAQIHRGLTITGPIGQCDHVVTGAPAVQAIIQQQVLVRAERRLATALGDPLRLR
jgi:hypothetical protein